MNSKQRVLTALKRTGLPDRVRSSSTCIAGFSTNSARS